MTVTIGRRELLAALGGAVAWPFAARAQQRGRVQRVGILMPYPKGDSENEARIRAFKQELARLGWTEGGNIQFDEHWTADNMDRVRAEELIADRVRSDHWMLRTLQSTFRYGGSHCCNKIIGNASYYGWSSSARCPALLSLVYKYWHRSPARLRLKSRSWGFFRC